MGLFNKIMKATVLFYCLLWVSAAAIAQVNTYTMVPTVETFMPITGTTVIPMVDDKLDTLSVPAFTFNGSSISSIVISSNGFIVLGNTHGYFPATYTALSATYAAQGVLSPFARDLVKVDSTSAILYEAVGNEIVVQWTNIKRASTTGEFLTFQVRINTTNSVVKFVYGPMTIANASSHPQIGLRGAASTDYINLAVTNVAGKTWLAPEYGTSNTAICVARVDANSVNPVNGLTYTWTPATCFVPANFANIGITASSLDFSWGRSIAAGEIAMYPSGGSIANATFIPVSGTSVSIPNLTADTRYAFQLREICGAGDSSAWSTMVSAKTACNPITTLPWTEDFEGILPNITTASVGGALPSTCWAYKGDISGAQGTLSYSRRARSGNKFLFTNYSTAPTTGDVVYTPGFELEKDSSYTFSFWYKGAGRSWDTVRALVGTMQDATMMTVIGQAVYNVTDSSNYVRYFGEFVPTTSGTYYFGANVFAGSLVDYFCFDDFKVEKTPSCPELYPVAVSNIAARTADITWTTNNAVEIVVRLANQTIAEGTILPLPNNTNTYTLTNLLPSKSYKVYIRQICAVGDTSDWSAAAKFSTSCDVLTAPWFEDFESSVMQQTSVLNIPACWAKTGDFKGDSVSGSYNRAAISGNNYIYTQYTTLSTTGDRLFTPTFNLEAGKTYTFSFWYAKQHNAGTFDSVKVSLTIDQAGSNAQAFGTPITGITGIVAPTMYSVEVTPSVSGNYNFMISVFAAGSPWYLVFDDFSLTENCTPATLSFNNTIACNTVDGSIEAIVNGGTAPFTYAWANGETSNTLNQVIANEMQVLTVTDAQGCTVVDSTFVEAAMPFAAAATTTNATCPTCTDGTVTLVLANTIDVVTFAWSNGETTQDLLAVGEGVYTVTITNGNGCAMEVMATVEADPLPPTDPTDPTDPTAVDETTLAAMVRLYPNPTNSIFTLEGFESSTEILVINSLGQLVMQTKAEQHQIQIDLSNLASGTYWVRMQNEKGSAILPVVKAQ